MVEMTSQKDKVICGLTFTECLQHTGKQCGGESDGCYWKNNLEGEWRNR